jgi:uncharacterized protein (DUF58 family)
MDKEEDIEEILQRVRRLEIKARRLAAEVFSGDYQSSFRGQGLDFDEFRPYQLGDEVRFIDWNVTAKMQEPYIRKFQEERELAVILAVDISGSTDYGSDFYSKRERAAELAALLGFSARFNGDKVGLLLFANGPVKYIPPAKGAKTVLRAVREILSTEPQDPKTSIDEAATFLLRTLKRKGLIFLISDFIDWGFERTLSSLARRHDLIALPIIDPLEKQIPDVGKVFLRDPETGDQILVNTSNSNTRMGLAKLSKRYREGLHSFFKKNGIDYAPVSTTDEQYLVGLHRLLQNRAHRKS